MKLTIHIEPKFWARISEIRALAEDFAVNSSNIGNACFDIIKDGDCSYVNYPNDEIAAINLLNRIYTLDRCDDLVE